MKIYKGLVNLIGAGTWTDTGGGGKTKLSVLEVGASSLKSIILPDYIRSYLTVGQDVEILVSRGLSQGIITRPFIAAIKVNGRTYKSSMGQLLLMCLIKYILYSGAVYGIITLGGYNPNLIYLNLLILAYYGKECVDYFKF